MNHRIRSAPWSFVVYNGCLEKNQDILLEKWNERFGS
jgi:hypothetical protein